MQNATFIFLRLTANYKSIMNTENVLSRLLIQFRSGFYSNIDETLLFKTQLKGTFVFLLLVCRFNWEAFQ